MHHLVAKLVSALYCIAGVLVLLAGLLVTLSNWSSSSPSASVAFAAICLVLGGTPLLAGLGLWRQQAWSRWFFLASALLVALPVVRSIPQTQELYRHFTHPVEGAYVVLTKEEFTGLFAQFFLQPFLVAVAAAVLAAFVFKHFRRGLTLPSRGTSKG
jgi:hypothetical protein